MFNKLFNKLFNCNKNKTEPSLSLNNEARALFLLKQINKVLEKNNIALDEFEKCFYE